MKSGRLLFMASWILLLVITTGLFLASLNSLSVAYFGQQDGLPGLTLEQIHTAGGEEAVKAFRGRRATAATFALAWALLSAIVVFVPYRRGERWAWWALLLSVIVSQLLSLARYAAVPTSSGAGAAGTLLGLFLLALLMGAPRMFKSTDISEL